MLDDTLLDAVGEAMALTVSARGLARDPETGRWIDAVTEIHQQDRHAAAQDLLVALDACGFSVQRKPAGAGNGLGVKMLRLATELARQDLDATRLDAIRRMLCDLATEARTRDHMVVPQHLRQVRDDDGGFHHV